MSGRVKQPMAKTAAALGEMASLGLTVDECCAVLEITPSWFYYVQRKHPFPSPPDGRRNRGWLAERIKRDYRHGLTSGQMAERYGTSANSVKVTICNLRKSGILPPAGGYARVTTEAEART